ncbi:MAG: phosphonoacetaldehyde hydrolase [Lachnospiraceae bacterium]|nr:phosphonoacetaldehyde hydrolase [Lachnospiraceae bacterium]
MKNEEMKINQGNNNIEAIIFDWAGTTVDYGSFAPVQAFIEAFQEFGLYPTEEEVRKPMGMLKRDHIKTMMQMPRIRRMWQERYGKDWTEQDVDAVYHKSETSILEILKDFAEPKDYVLETIQELRNRGIKIGSTTGYTTQMMNIVVPKAAENGYAPDYWSSPSEVENHGRPYPYMIFRNMQALNISSVHRVIKVGDTVADIKEGKNAGMRSVGIIEGSSVMGYSRESYEKLTEQEKEKAVERATKTYLDAGADDVIQDIRGILQLL